MKATTILLAFALIVAVSSAQTTNVTGTNCTADHTVCATKNPMFCCANIVRYINATYNNVSQACVNQTIANKTVDERRYASTYGNATCIVSATTSSTNNSFLVKLSVAVASLGFLSLFL